MRSLLALALALSFTACLAQSGDTVDPDAPDLALQEEALSLGQCTAPEVSDALTWSSPTASQESCDGSFSYLRYGTCMHQDPSCGKTCPAFVWCPIDRVRSSAQVNAAAFLPVAPGVPLVPRPICPCGATPIAATCMVKHRDCGSTLVTLPRGLTYAQAEAQVRADPAAAPLAEAELTCSTCENLPLPAEAVRRVPEAQVANKALVEAKYNCLLSQMSQLPEGQLAPLSRNLILLYETWGEFLPYIGTLEPVKKAYALIEGLGDLNQCGPVRAVEVPKVCGIQWASLNSTMLRCERLLGEHVSDELRQKSVGQCNDALATYRRLVNPAAGCDNPAYEERMFELVRLLHPLWNANEGHVAEEPTYPPTATVHDTVVGAAPKGYSCPLLPRGETGWYGGLLFGPRPMKAQPLGDDGAVFCRYDYDGPASELDYDNLPIQLLPCNEPGIPCGTRNERSGAVWLRPDVKEIPAQAPGLFGDVAARLMSEYLTQLDAPLSSGVLNTAQKVDLAILDGLPESPADETRPIAGEGHGRALAVAAYRAACPSGPDARCPLNIRSYRAFRPDGITSLSDLAIQIVRAVDHAQARGTRLVMNVSLGLHPRFAYWDRPDHNYPRGVLLPAFRALKAALNYASAHGAITVAAAGNTDGLDAQVDDRSDELLYPAAFDGVPGWQCDVDRECTADASRGLVIAAGGVTADNQPLPNARFTTRSVPFVAPACNVALDNTLPWETPQAALPTYCGTSFGAIGVSAVLAATWTHLPSVSPAGLLSAVRAQGIDATTGAQGCSDHDCRVRMCASLRAAGANVTCGSRAVPAVDPARARDFVSANAVPVSWQGAGEEDDRDRACGSDVVYTGTRNSDSCPNVRYASELPDSEMLSDQPPSGRCPQCGVIIVKGEGEGEDPGDEEAGTAYFVGSVEPGAEPVTSPSLKVGTRTYELDSQLAPLLTNGGSFAIPLTGTVSTGTTAGVASLSYLKQSATGTVTAQVDPLPILR